jgi:uncharacterized protein (DUF2141 family)
MLKNHRSSNDDAGVRFSSSNSSSVPLIQASSSSNTSSAASFKNYLATAAAEIEAETTKFLVDLKAKHTQTVLKHTLEMNNIKNQQGKLELQREKEVLRHAQQLAESERAQNACCNLAITTTPSLSFYLYLSMFSKSFYTMLK